MRLKLKVLLVSLLAVLLLVSVFGCGGGTKSEDETKGPTIVVASKTFTESIILGEMLVELLQYHGYPVQNEVGLGETAILRPALVSGEISVYYEYTGTVLMTQMQQPGMYDPEECYQAVKKWDLETNNIVWLDYAPGNNTYEFIGRPGIKAEYGFETISDFVEYSNNNPNNDFKFAMLEEWYEREDGLTRFADIYGLDRNNINPLFLGMGLTYDALREKQADFGIAFSTDGRIAAFGLESFEDDKKCFPVYNPAPTVHGDIIEAYPEIVPIINELSALLDNETLMELNKRVDVDGEETYEVAKDFLKKNGLIK